MMWRTSDARDVGFNESLEGYGQGEDLEFSLRIRARGRLVLAERAALLHLQERGGRPESFEMGYHGLRNLFYIHRTCLPNRTSWDTAYFLYAFAMDTVVRCAALLKPGRVAARWQFIRGRVRFFAELLRLGMPTGWPARRGAVQ